MTFINLQQLHVIICHHILLVIISYNITRCMVFINNIMLIITLIFTVTEMTRK